MAEDNISVFQYTNKLHMYKRRDHNRTYVDADGKYKAILSFN